MGFYADFNAVYARVKADLEAVSALKNVVLGEQFRVTKLPMAIINVGDTVVAKAEIGTMLQVTLNFTVILVIRETEPKDWFAEIVSPMGDVLDALVADSTSNSTVKDLWPTRFSPAEIRFTDKLYYGGVVSFQALMFHTPS